MEFNNNTYYCIPDLHGRFDLLELALKYIYEKQPGGCEIIFLGDYIDRGPDNSKVLQAVMNPPDNYRFTCLLGNHEDMFIDAYTSKTAFYDLDAAIEISETIQPSNHEELVRGIDVSIVEWMETLYLFYAKDKNMFAHAFYDDNFLPEEQSRHDCIWERISDVKYKNKNQGYFLVHGHTPRTNGPILGTNKLNLDVGAVFTGKLIIAEFMLNKQGPVDFHEFEIN